MNMYPTLIDSYNRQVKSLRISITKRCNLNCIYCHNEGNGGATSHEMPPEMIAQIVGVASRHGVNRVKFSGGEPLIRQDFEEIISLLPRPNLKNISATTNGIGLKERAAGLKEAGLDRVNISLDSLNPARYSRIIDSNGGKKLLKDTVAGISAAVDAGLTPVKINMVLIDNKTVTDNGADIYSEIDDMMDFASGFDGKVILQLIELMDTGHNASESSGGHAPNSNYRRFDVKAIEDMLKNRATSIKTRTMHRRKKYVVDGLEVEVVRPVDNSEFCANCNRLRLTSDGMLKSCLLRNDDLFDINNKTDEQLHRIFVDYTSRRKPYYTPTYSDIHTDTYTNFTKSNKGDVLQ